MNTQSEHIHPVFDQLLPRTSKETLLHQRAKVFWFTGLSGSGKSTIARGVERALHQSGRLVMVLDGDNVRIGINNNLGFSEEDRRENIRRIAEVAKLFLNCGVIVVCSFISPTRELRNLARQIVGAADFVEIFVNTPLEECERRDVKGLYAKAREGIIKDFTGVSAPFELPEHPDLELHTKGKTVEESVEETMTYIRPLITLAH